MRFSGGRLSGVGEGGDIHVNFRPILNKTIFWSRMSIVIVDKVVTKFPTPQSHINTIKVDSVRIFKYGCQNPARKFYNNCSKIVVFGFGVSTMRRPSVDRSQALGTPTTKKSPTPTPIERRKTAVKYKYCIYIQVTFYIFFFWEKNIVNILYFSILYIFFIQLNYNKQAYWYLSVSDFLTSFYHCFINLLDFSIKNFR